MRVFLGPGTSLALQAVSWLSQIPYRPGDTHSLSRCLRRVDPHRLRSMNPRPLQPSDSVHVSTVQPLSTHTWRVVEEAHHTLLWGVEEGCGHGVVFAICTEELRGWETGNMRSCARGREHGTQAWASGLQGVKAGHTAGLATA